MTSSCDFGSFLRFFGRTIGDFDYFLESVLKIQGYWYIIQFLDFGGNPEIQREMICLG